MARPGGYFKTPPKKRKPKAPSVKPITENTLAAKPHPKTPALVPFTMIDKKPIKVTKTIKKGGKKYTQTTYKRDTSTGPLDLKTWKPKYRHTYIHKETGLPLRVEKEGTKKQRVKIMAPHVNTPQGPIYYRRAEAQKGRGDVATKNFKLKMFRGPDIPVIGQGKLSKTGTLSLRGANVKIGKLPSINYDDISFPGEAVRAVAGGYKKLNKLTTPPTARYGQGDIRALTQPLGKIGKIQFGTSRAIEPAVIKRSGTNPITLDEIVKPLRTGVKTGGKEAFKLMAAPQRALYKGLGVKSGADIAQAIGLERQFGLAPDLVLDPLMWASVVAAPETGGASLAALTARIEATGMEGRVVLASKAVQNAAARTRATRDASHLRDELQRQLDINPKLAEQAKAVSKKQVRQTQRALRGKQTKEIINSLKMGAEEADFIPKRAGLRERITPKAVKGKGKTKVYVPGLEGPEAVLGAARSVEAAGLTRPGLRFQMISPVGSRRLFGKDLPGLTVPLPEALKVPAGKRIRSAAFSLEKQQQIGKIVAKYDQPLKDLDEMTKKLRQDTSIPQDAKVTQAYKIQETSERLRKTMDAEIHRITRELNKRGPRHLVDLGTRAEVQNAHRLARTINPVADEFGRMVSNRYMRLVHDAVSILPKNVKTKQRSLERVDLLMRAMHEGAGAEAVLERAGFKFTDAERTVAQSLRKIYDDYLRHGQELGVLGPGIQSGHYVPRVWTNTDRRASMKTEDVVNHIVDNLTGGVGSHSSFLHQRVHPETFTLHGRESLKDAIARLSDDPNLNDEALSAAADALHDRGKMKLAGNLLLRGLLRGQIFRLGEDPIIDRAYEYLRKIAPKRGQTSVPLVTEEDGVIRLSDHDLEGHYGIRKDQFDTPEGRRLSEEAKKGVNFQLAAEDLANVRRILDDMESKHLDADYHKFLEDQNTRLAAEANSHLNENWGLRTQDFVQPGHVDLTPEKIKEVHDAIQTIDPKYRAAPVTVVSEATAGRLGESRNVFGWYSPSQNRVFIVHRTDDEWRNFYARVRGSREWDEGPPGGPPPENWAEPPIDPRLEESKRLINPENHWDSLTHIEDNAPSEVAGIARNMFDGLDVTRLEMEKVYVYAVENRAIIPGAEDLITEMRQVLYSPESGSDNLRMLDPNTFPRRETRPKAGVEGNYAPVPDYFGQEIKSIIAEKKLQQGGYGKGPLSEQVLKRENRLRSGDPANPSDAKILTYEDWRDAHSYRSTLIHEYTHDINLRKEKTNQWSGEVEVPGGTISKAAEASRHYIGANSLSGLTFDPLTGSATANIISNFKKVEKEAKKIWSEHLPGGKELDSVLTRMINKTGRTHSYDDPVANYFGKRIRELKAGPEEAPHYGETFALFGEHAGGMIEIIPRFAQMMARNEEQFIKLFGKKDAAMFKEAVLGIQSGVKLDRRIPEIKTNDNGMAWIMDPKGQPPDVPPPHTHGAGPFEDPFNYSQFLPDMRDENMEIILDPRRTNYYRTRSQGVVAATVARVQTIDRQMGRSFRDTQASVVLPDGRSIPASQLRLGGQTSDDATRFYIDVSDNQVYAESDLFFPERSLIPNSDHSIYYDPQTHKEYAPPTISSLEGQPARVMTVGADRLWPTDIIDSFRQELGQAGRYDRLFYSGMDGLGGRVLATIRYGVTTPFPAYHVRNMVSDILKSLQADSGVLFHPIANAKLAAAAFGKTSGYIRVPGYGKLPLEDFLFMADTFGLNSGHHVAEIYRLMEAGQWNETAAKRMLQEISLIGPNSRFGQAAIHFGNSRENVMRFITFMQRLRRNDGDAADAALYMIRHHFNYNDITMQEKRVFRNIFLFYTWYRKNIPLQLLEIGRRPGFFAAIAHSYGDFAAGETPINQDYSKIAPWLPDLTGALPKQNLIPSYYENQLGALEGNWNGHSLAIGFGAPWSDLALLRLNQDGFNQTLSMMNPAITTAYSIGTRRDTLTGRDLMANEPSGMADLVDQIERLAGHKLPRDKKGQPVLPYWVDRVLRNVPIAGRAFGSIGAPTDPKRDPGRAQTLSRSLAPVLGLNVFMGPGKGGKREKLAQSKAAAAMAAQLNDYKRRIANMPADQRDKMANAKRKELEAKWKEKGLPLRVLYNAHGWPKPKWAQKKRGRKKKVGNFSSGRVTYPGSGTPGSFPGSGGF